VEFTTAAMMVEVLKKMFLRDLGKLKTEIELYRDEQKIWYVEKQITNTAGNLCLHLLGSLNNFIGAELAGTGYVRDRDLEFSSGMVPRAQLLKSIDETILMITSAFDNITNARLAEDFPKPVFNETVTNAFLVMHMTVHLNYHLGQINYHRRLLDN
jgi:uncharacterized damage-inducible protein DinB